MLPNTPDSASFVDGGRMVAEIRESRVAILTVEVESTSEVNQLKQSRAGSTPPIYAGGSLEDEQVG